VTTGPKAPKVFGLKKNFLWTKKKIRDSTVVVKKKKATTKRTTATVRLGESFKTT